jgi:amidase
VPRPGFVDEHEILPGGHPIHALVPVGISFLGPAFSEGRLLGLGYAFEQRTRARRDPVTTPSLIVEGVGR